MWQKILQPLVLGPARAGALQKPVVVIGQSTLPLLFTWSRSHSRNRTDTLDSNHGRYPRWRKQG